jgi:PAS domain S-box-containing protein
VGELRRLAAKFIGRERVDLAFANALADDGPADFDALDRAPADAELVGFTERLLSGCIGSASARSVLTAGLRRSGMNRDDAMSLLEQTSSAIQFNRDLLEATLDHLSQGISVVDADLRLVSWNRAYVDLLGYPSSMVYLGRPVEELIRFNLERDHGGPGADVEAAVDRRLHHMRRGTSYVYERRHGDGRVIEIRGNPMPHGGYVTTFTDITSFKRNEADLKSAYDTMEQQVNRRTRELRATMEALEAAKHDAEQADRSKTRFLAAASHDLLQPLNAARLFASNLSQRAERLDGDEARLVRRIDHSLGVAEELLSALLDISRLDQGALQPNFSTVPVAQLLDKVERQFAALAERRGLKLRVRPCRARVRTRSCCSASCSTWSTTRCATRAPAASSSAAGPAATSCASRSGTPDPELPNPSANASSRSSSAWTAAATNPNSPRAWDWACRSAAASAACWTRRWTWSPGPAAAACSRSPCRVWPASRPPRRRASPGAARRPVSRG